MSWNFGFDSRVFDLGMGKQSGKRGGKKSSGGSNPFWDGLDLGDSLNFGNIYSGGNLGGGSDFYKYLDYGYGDLRGVGRDSKKGRSRRTVSYKDSPELYGLEGLEIGLGESYGKIEKGAKQIKENFRAGPTKARAYYKRKVDSELRIPRKIGEKIREFGVRRKIKQSLEPALEEHETSIGKDQSKEISEAYGEVRSRPATRETKYGRDYDDESKEKYR